MSNRWQEQGERKRGAMHVKVQAVEQSPEISAHATMQIAYPMEKGDRGDKSKAPVGEIVDPRHCRGFSSEARSIDEGVPIFEHHPCHRPAHIHAVSVTPIPGNPHPPPPPTPPPLP